jgi:amino acid transporter
MVVVSAGGGVNKKPIGFTYWKHGAFRAHLYPGSTGQFLSFWYTIVKTCFAYTGAEVVGASFGEATNPKKSIPKAIRLTAIRILTLYVGSVFLLTLAVSPDSPMLQSALSLGKSGGGSSSPLSRHAGC